MLVAINQNTPFIAIDRRANRDNISTSKLYDFLDRTDLRENYLLSNELTEDVINSLAERIKTVTDGDSCNDYTEIVHEQQKMALQFIEQLNEIWGHYINESAQ